MIEKIFPDAIKVIEIDLNKYFIITKDYSLHFVMFELTGVIVIDKVNEDILELISLNQEKLYQLFKERANNMTSDKVIYGEK